jgi:2-oxoisovalerate dehydrogenase E2 component (dihydrolipoyl transacylase)
MIAEFRLPDVGEGLTEADIVSWHVKPGDRVEVNQIIVEIETAKAVVELPSPYDGVVTKLLADEGQTVDVGVPIIAVEVDGAINGSARSGAEVAAEVDPARGSGGDDTERAGGSPPAPERNPVLVGYGVRPSSTVRRPRRTSAPAAPAAQAAPTPQPSPIPQATPIPQAAPIPRPAPAQAGPTARASAVLAKPPVRKLARDLGIDLSALTGTGPEGSITRVDVQRAAEGETTLRSVPMIWEPQPAANRHAEERIPVRGVRKHTAAAMVASAFTAPHVTEFLQVDVTETMAAVRRVRDLPEFAELRVSPLLFVARALLRAAARHPMINSSWDEAAQEIVVKNYVNLGIAAATERGLIVPNVKDAGSLSMAGLAAAFAELTATARAGKSTPADLSGGTMTITNVGVFGIDAGTPILTPGESCILAFGQVRDMPWVHAGELAIRKVTTLSLSFDHRIVDGELGSAVLRDVGSMLEDPVRLLAWS